MGDHIVWKEAKSHGASDNEDEADDDEGSDQAISCDEETSSEQMGSDPGNNSQEKTPKANLHGDLESNETIADDLRADDASIKQLQSRRSFSHHQVSLSLKRDITKLADPAQHKPKPNHARSGPGSQSFDQWIEGALVAISPTADMILFSSQSPEKVVFVAKLRMDPLNEYTTKALDIPLDYDEQVTSLLCLPIMSTQRTSLGLVDWTALVVGLSSGYVKFYTEQSICLLSLKFCDEPVVNVKLQTQKVNTNARSQTHFATIVDELFITHRSCAIVIDGIGLYENLRISKEDVIRNKSNYEPAYNISNLPTILTCQKWKFEESRDSRVLDADLLGMRCTTRFDTLKSNSINYDHVPAKSCTRTLVLVGKSPFLSCYREAKETVSHSYTEMIGSLLPFWGKPQPSRVQINEISCSTSLSMFDKGRLATSIVPSPDRRLAAMTDDFGRVTLVDVTNWLIVRIWKGYRNAQCGWVEVKRDSEEAGTPHASFLVIYAPKRGLLEVWSVQRGLRVAAFNVGKHCRLLYAGYRMLNTRAEAAANKSRAMNLLTEQSFSNNCYLLNAQSEALFAIELPYTYSLYKYGDLKSRDRLLINELQAAIQHDAEVSSMSEIIQRMVLAESLQISIHKLAANLQPDKIVPVMENLIIKIMKEYDNHAGETMSADDQSIVELCKRLIRLCSMFSDLSKLGPSDEISLPDVNQRLIDEHEEHPKEVDEFAQQLGWEASEVLRYLSLMALERSFRREAAQSPWPNMGEPLTWAEFVGCFDLERINCRLRKNSTGGGGAGGAGHQMTDKISIKLKELSSKFLKEDRFIKTSVFMYNKLSERYYRALANAPETIIAEMKDFNRCYTHLEPSSRLVLLFQFWLSTKLCNHWKMWAFLQQQVGIISDELRVIAMASDDNELLIKSWKRVYQLILESDNIYAAIIATATIRSDTLRMISDNEKREKLDRDTEQRASDSKREGNDQDNNDDDDVDQKALTIDWECLCVDAERMSIFSQQLEDVFLLGMLLKYSPTNNKLVDRFVYRVPRISVANIVRGGPTIVSELIAQWVVQANVKPLVFTQPYGSMTDDDQHHQQQHQADSRERPKLFTLRFSSTSDGDEHTKELLHHVKTSFPRSIDPDVLLLNCIWEFCNRWTSSQTAREKARLLDEAFDCLSLLSAASLRHNAACWAYKTFFQRTFERLTILIETNSTILSPKCLRSRDTLARRELNMGESCLEGFVAFCFKLSDFMLDTSRQRHTTSDAAEEKNAPASPIAAAGEPQESHERLHARLMAVDEWWSTPSVVKMVDYRSNGRLEEVEQNAARIDSNFDSCVGEPAGKPAGGLNMIAANRNSLVSASLSSSKLFDISTLIELNRLATLMLLIFKLRIIKTYPLSIIGEESRQTLRLDLQQTPTTGADMKSRSGLLNELRQKFARKCIVSIVAGLATEEEAGEFEDEAAGRFDDAGRDRVEPAASQPAGEDIDTSDDEGKQSARGCTNKAKQHQTGQRRDNQATSGSAAPGLMGGGGGIVGSTKRRPPVATATIDAVQTENNESMALFTHLLSLACEWRIDSDELHLELAFELYRCNHDKLAAQVANRTRDKQTLASGLLKISSQRVLALFGLSPQLSSANQWRKRVDKWSLFQPNVASWLKSIQGEEARHELGQLVFAEAALRQSAVAPSGRTKRTTAASAMADVELQAGAPDDDLDLAATSDDFDFYMEQSLGLRLPALESLCERTKLVLETVTNYLDGQANRLAYDLLQLLESGALAKFLASEKALWLKFRQEATVGVD